MPRFIFCLGDSLTRGHLGFSYKAHPYSSNLQKLLDGKYGKGNIIVKSFGVSGATITEITEYYVDEFSTVLEEEKCEKHCDLLILMAGTNDLASFERNETIVEDMKERLTKLVEVASAKFLKSSNVLQLTMPDAAFKEDKYVECRRKVNDFVLSSPLSLDVEKMIPFDEENSRYWSDSLHFSEEGYDKLGAIIYDKVISLKLF